MSVLNEKKVVGAVGLKEGTIDPSTVYSGHIVWGSNKISLLGNER